ncbi:spore germination lipoprotein GerD [Bacillus sp. CGMCC 1.16607]|uniref:spore germination lipoprotein GerD n=1 Tax=Bacillus sp. CGMCC 1.16607 TaxID=3351842 RepID=UPI0036363E50
MFNEKRLLLLIFMIFTIAGCSGNESSGGELDYEQTKKMVVDILKTDDGKKAIQDVMADDKMQEKLVMDQKVVTETIEKTLTSEKGEDFWKKSFEDPKFAESVAKSMKKENEKLLKDLMKDPEYRGMMMEIMKDPELTKDLTTVLKSKEYREHLQKVITETFNSPLFKVKMQEILIKAAEELKGSEAKSGEGEDKGSGSDSGEGSGSEGDSSGG